MRSRKYAACACALLLSMLAGCAATAPSNNNELPIWAAAAKSQTIARPSLSLGDTPQKPLEFEFSHPRVDDFVALFQSNLRGFFTRALERSGRYVPQMTEILEKEGLPAQLAYLPLIESGFRTHAVSRAGAVGPWQIIPATARRYGLRIDGYVDERRDPVKSTQAAARYLKDLHGMFGDWHLSLAAYNTGEGRISRILRKGNAENFWEMSERGYLVRETKNYVPEFLAALQIAEQPESYGFDPPEPDPLVYERVVVRHAVPLTTIANLSGASTDHIKELNPALHRGVVPQGYVVRIPKGTKQSVEVALERMPKPQYRPQPVKRQAKAPARKPAARRRAVAAKPATRAAAVKKPATRAVAAKKPAARPVAAKKGAAKPKVVAKPSPARRKQAAPARRGRPAVVATGKKPQGRAVD